MRSDGHSPVRSGRGPVPSLVWGTGTDVWTHTRPKGRLAPTRGVSGFKVRLGGSRGNTRDFSVCLSRLATFVETERVKSVGPGPVSLWGFPRRSRRLFGVGHTSLDWSAGRRRPFDRLCLPQTRVTPCVPRLRRRPRVGRWAGRLRGPGRYVRPSPRGPPPPNRTVLRATHGPGRTSAQGVPWSSVPSNTVVSFPVPWGVSGGTVSLPLPPAKINLRQESQTWE